MTDVVDRVLAALNARDLETFVGCYAPDATIENGYDEVRVRGRDELHQLYGGMFERFPAIHVEAGWRTDIGAFVVQDETVTGRGGHERHVAVYLIEEGLIARERLVA